MVQVASMKGSNMLSKLQRTRLINPAAVVWSNRAKLHAKYPEVKAAAKELRKFDYTEVVGRVSADKAEIVTLTPRQIAARKAAATRARNKAAKSDMVRHNACNDA